ncbi:histidine kinase [Xanthomonadaceae bacterium JHOS43]|nr:histidine kinase [Xanthomonadaceae bacterium JHOS43]MCX7564080.1 histidine kinase [Xanthomonadaceae bacterium XH05]
MKSRRFSPAQLWVGLLAMATAVSLLLFLDRYLDRLASDRTTDWLRILIEESTATYVAALLVPVMVYATRKLPPFGPRWQRNIPLHVLIALAVGFTHTTATSALRHLLIALPELAGAGDYSLDPRRYLLALPAGFIVYAVVVALTLVVDRYRGARNRELEAVELRAQLTQAQLLALQRQLEPQFLFGSLRSIAQLVYANPKGAEEMIARMTALLRHSLDSEKTHETTLADELRVLDLYLEMMRLRYAERLFVQVDAPPELARATVPRFLLQPLVENALAHGDDPAMTLVAVRVTVRAENESLVIRVRDHSHCEDQSPRSIGIINAAARIAQLYGAGSGVSSERTAEGIEVTVRLPLRLPPV